MLRENACGAAPALVLIGLLMLMGIVSKNSILLVEYAIMAQRHHGLSRSDALLDSRSKRAPPIVMTSIAMLAGMTPVAMAWAGDPSFRSPMGLAVIGGLVVSTVVSLFIVPAFFTVIDDFPQWLGRVLQRPPRAAAPDAAGKWRSVPSAASMSQALTRSRAQMIFGRPPDPGTRRTSCG